MKACMMTLILLSMIVVGCGCGGGASSDVSETKSIADCKTEAEAMSEDALKASIKNYQEAIKAKMGEFEELKAEMNKNGRSEEITDKALKLKDSMEALQERAEIYFKAGAKKFGNL